MSDGSKELLKDGIIRESHLMEEFHLDLEQLVSKYLERVKVLSFFTLGWHDEGIEKLRKERADDSNHPDKVREKLTTYLNVLAAMADPIRYDNSFYSSMVMDALHALEGTPHWAEAFAAWKVKLDSLEERNKVAR